MGIRRTAEFDRNLKVTRDLFNLKFGDRHLNHPKSKNALETNLGDLGVCPRISAVPIILLTVV